MKRRLTAVLAADVVGYSRLMEKDEARTLGRLKALHQDLMRPVIAAHNGRVVKLMGDGLLAEFSSVVEAVNCGVEIQDAIAGRETELPETDRVQLRIGVNLGDVMVEGADIYGDGVNIAARLEGLAEPGGLCISGQVFDAVYGKLDLAFDDIGSQKVKNIARPIRAYRLAPKMQLQSAPAQDEELPPLPDKPSIVVLPFSNISGELEQAYFADGITEDVTTELSRFGELFVIARNTASTFKEQNLDPCNIAQELGVHFVLEGSVRRAGERVRINAQLIDGQSGNHIWADRYDGQIEEVFDLQDQVTQQVVGAIVPSINEAQLARIRRGDRVFDTAHELAWRAYDEMFTAFRLADTSMMRTAKKRAYKAITLNERCLRAYATICIATWIELLLQWTDAREEAIAELKQTAERFLRLEPTSHLAHYCHGILNMVAGRTEAGAEALRHSANLNPNDASVLALLAYAEADLDNLAEAKRTAATAIRLSPKDPWTGTAYLALALAAFVEDDALFPQWAERAILAEPTGPVRRLLMIAYAAEVDDRSLLDEHLKPLNEFAPRFLPRFLSGELNLFRVPRHREKVLKALHKANLK